MNDQHERISPSARHVAYLRAQTAIPYCAEIARMCDAEATFTSLTNGDLSQREARCAYLELRFLSLNACISRIGSTQVLELAGGVAPRGLILTEDPSMLVIETDLADMIAEKQSIVTSLIPFAARSNYRLHAANALHNDELWDAADRFGREPLTIVHEGLLMYFDAVERAQLAANVRSLLEFYGGAWITPDVGTRGHWEHFYGSSGGGPLSAISTATGCDIMENAFAGWDDAQAFFSDEGFTCDRLKQVDLVPEMRKRVSTPEALERVESESIWVMRLRKN